MIQIGTKWVHTRTGNQYEVVDIFEQVGLRVDKLIREVWYKDQQGEIYVRTEKEFLESFKSIEIVYEYRYAYQEYPYAVPKVTSMYYKDDAGFKTAEAHDSFEAFQRLDFTKKERKQ